MERFPVGITLLLIGSIVIYLGLAQRALDRMRLSDRGALLVIAAIIIGSYINIPIPFAPFNTSINVGGALVPIGLAIYLLAKAGTAKEWSRAVIGAVVTAIAVYIIGSLVNSGSTVEPAGRYAILDAIYLYPLVGGIVAYIFGRSRRAAFISATLGVLLVDIFHYVWLLRNGAPGNYNVAIGGGGAFDTIILAGIVAILLAEVIGESFERLSGGPSAEGRPHGLVQGLQKPELGVSDESSQNMHREAESSAFSDKKRKEDVDKHEGKE
ncbi:MAG: hypothetical protein A4E52_02167 [Pelotomaculum sp. PtaB.Bin013]|uniref:DUF1614 domain-containing protein n=1 Tax=Pelotomaculum isophthalicicum JI TaxID=947010 RepID=A0A9X4GY16_9FIRM|nr:DUF1614 domain-containing protein [Pelotomaculum isophthalicicum]MDF9407370.1 DUF1614 domain-containing protein [Pelotomaculum isophthalicicum JI]OPX81694.1 MAG: hypothetical protein A4E52_02167 [Pelotomaculum sp. PtaB.Bin013]